MNLLARARTFFMSGLGKWLMSAVTIVAVVIGVYSSAPLSVSAQQTGGTPTPANTPTTPAPVRPTTPTATPTGQTDGTTASGVARSALDAAAAVSPTAAVAAGAVRAYDALSSGVSNIDGWSCVASGGLSPSCVAQVVGVIATTIFSVITYFLSKILVLITSVLIIFARYDAFNAAPPVGIGWTIVRDLMNVLFVVALLASALATITGYGGKDLHYTKVLPGIFMGAIMVNFSRTIMLLMIDASQVVMLTFISAFEGTIAGNVFQAFGISKLANFQTEAQSFGGNVTNISSILLAYMLAIGLLMTAVTIILAYVAYFIGRIVGLWLLIIISPVYFAAKFLPSTIGGPIGSMTKSAEKKMSALLVGGPQVAFFLWIAFATVQQTAESSNAAQAFGFEVPDSIAGDTIGFISRIGTVPEIAGFIVASAMLGMGLSTVQSIAGEVGMGDIAKKMTGWTTGWKDKLQRAPWTMAKSGVGYANRRFGITNQLAQGMARGAAGLPGGGSTLQNIGGGAGRLLGSIPGIGGVLAGTAAAGVAGVAAKGIAQNRKEAKERIDSLKSLSTTDQVAAIRRMDQDGLVSREQREANHEALMDSGRRKEYQKQLEEEIKQSMLASIPANMDEARRKVEEKEIPARAKAAAADRLRADEAGRIQSLSDLAQRASDHESMEKLKKQQEKAMLYGRDEKGAKAYSDQVKSALDDTKKFAEMDADALKEGRLAVEMLTQRGALIRNSDGTATIEEAKYNAVQELVKDNKELSATLEETKRMVGGGAKVDEVAQARRAKDAYGADRFFGNAQRQQADGSTRVQFSAVVSPVEEGVLRTLHSAGSESRAKGAMYTENQARAFSDAMKAGLPFAQIKSILDGVAADGQSINQLSAYAASVMRDTNQSLEKRIEAVGEIARIAKKEGSAEQQANIFLGAMPADMAEMSQMMWLVSNMSGERQKDFSNLAGLGAVAENGNGAVAARLRDIRQQVTSQKKVKVQVQAPVRNDDGSVAKNPDGTTKMKFEEREWEMPSGMRRMFSAD